ncbi:MAG: response regulator [Pseudomonadota bacterium]
MKKFQDAKILIVHGTPYNRKMLSGILQLLGVKTIENAFESTDALSMCQDTPFNVVIAEMKNGVSDAIALSKSLRQNPNSPNHVTPVLALGDSEAEDILEEARTAGVTDFLKTPYSADNIAERVLYAINTPPQEQIQDAASPPRIEEKKEEAPKDEWPNPEESNSLTTMLMDHYLRHHEIVLTKLRFAQDATKSSIDDIRNIHEKIKETKGSQESNLNDFGDMWESIIKKFVNGGLSEQALFDIEKIITQIPDDIKQHYDDLTNKDKEFLRRMEKLNKSSYASAKKRVLSLQEEPNALTGKTSQDYQKAITKKEEDSEDEGSVKAIVYDPVKQKMIFKSYKEE